MSKFVKIAELDGESKSELKSYFTELYGPDYASAMVQEYDTAKKGAEKTESKK